MRKTQSKSGGRKQKTAPLPPRSGQASEPATPATSYKVVEAEFTPAEVATITGVSTDLQRDWRRRGFLGAAGTGKEARYRASDLGYLFAMKSFSELGVSVQEAQLAAAAATEVIWRAIAWPEFNMSGDRFVFWQSGSRISRGPVEALAMVAEEDFTKDGKAAITVIFDCFAAASQIVARSPRPLRMTRGQDA